MKHILRLAVVALIAVCLLALRGSIIGPSATTVGAGSEHAEAPVLRSDESRSHARGAFVDDADSAMAGVAGSEFGRAAISVQLISAVASTEGILAKADPGEEALPILFHVEGSPGDGRIRYSLAGSDSSPSELALSAGSAQAMLAPGQWVACYIDEEKAVGQARAFAVTKDAEVVELMLPGTFETSFIVKDYRTQAVIVGATGKLERADLLAFNGPSERLGTTPVSDLNGVMCCPGTPYGEVRFTVDARGYASQSFTLMFPSEFRPDIERSGRVDLGELSLVALTTFNAQLVGFEDWGGAEGFSIAHTHEGERAYFDATGHATLELGWYSDPLYVKWWWPDDEQEAIAYLDGGMPAPGEPWVIDVSTDRDLEVDLRISDEMLERFDLSQGSVRVVSANSRGDAVLRGLEVSTAGVYTIRGTSGQAAMVEYAALIGEGVISLALEKIRLREDSLTTCILNVDRLPTKVRFVDAAGEPIPHAHLDLRERDNDTTWSFGSDANDEGVLEAALPLHLELSMRASAPGTDLEAIDCQIEAPPAGDELTIPLVCSEPTTIRVTIDGEPAADQAVHLIGDHSPNLCVTVTTLEDGATKALRITDDSHPRAVLASEAHWTAAPSIALQQGENLLTAYTLGTLELSESVSLGSVTHVTEGASLEQWHRSGAIEALGKSGRRFEVPSGSYQVQHPDGSTTWVTVRPGESTRAN